MAETKDPAQVLEDAADLLLVRGRCTLNGSDSRGRYCVLGAIAEVSGVPCWTLLREADPALIAVADRVRSSVVNDLSVEHLRYVDLGKPKMVVYCWNDAREDEDYDFEVIDTLRLVAKDLRNAAAAS